MTHLLQSWPSSVDTSERTRRLLDLFLVSVLLDAGAGTAWSYKSKENGKIYRRSEGLAVASLEMFKTGMFSSDPDQPFRVDSDGLRRLTVEAMGKGLQVTAQNPITGLDGRANLLIRLSKALENRQYFGDDSRPGNIIGKDYPLHGATSRSHNTLNKTITNFSRLPDFPPNHANLLRPHRSPPNTVARAHGRARTHLARLPHSSRRSQPWRRLAPLFHAARIE